MQLGERAGLEPAEQLRNVLGRTLLEICHQHDNVVVLDGDLGNSTGAHTVKKAHPNRFFNLGIAESNLVGVAAGMASSGYIPFVSSFPSFLLANAYDQIRLQVSIGNLNVKLFGSHSGLTTAREGPPPMSIEDYALVGALPPFVMLVPSDPASMRAIMHAAADHRGPVYIRSSREALPWIHSKEDFSFAIGRSVVVREGGDVALLGCGLMTAVCLDAAVLLAGRGIEARVVDVLTLKPMDQETVIRAAKETGAIVTAEEHLIRGGMGATVAQIVVRSHPVPVRFIGLDNTYGDSGSLPELMTKYGLTAEHVAAAAESALAAKKEGGR